VRVNIEIIKKALIHDAIKIQNLNEKELVKNMMTRRRLTRSSRILMYLANECNFTKGTMIYASAYGELIDSVNILEAINTNKTVSPTSFQHSVYNTAASYHSIVHKNTSEILTLSSGENTSYCAMQQAALSLLKEEEVFVCAIEVINFKGIELLNKCKDELEYGVAFTLKLTDKKANIKVIDNQQKGLPSSLSWMKNLYDKCEDNQNPVVEVEL